MSNHNGNANKMVSDTPRTEAEVNRQKCWSDDLVTIDANFACQLERELNAANDRIKSLIEERDRANRLAEWKWNLRGEFESLLGTDNIEEGIKAVKALMARIKRLEDCAETAWGIIANVSGGNWAEQRVDWREAAIRWRDERFKPEFADRKAKEAKP